jgi:hypothetical protein
VKQRRDTSPSRSVVQSNVVPRGTAELALVSSDVGRPCVSRGTKCGAFEVSYPIVAVPRGTAERRFWRSLVDCRSPLCFTWNKATVLRFRGVPDTEVRSTWNTRKKALALVWWAIRNPTRFTWNKRRVTVFSSLLSERPSFHVEQPREDF